GRRSGDVEKLPAAAEFSAPDAIAEPAKVAQALEATGQGMQQEAADKLGGQEGQQVLPVAVPIVLPTESHLVGFEFYQALIGDGDAMGVAAEVGEHLLWPTEGRLGIDHPFFTTQGRQEARERAGVIE